jgi:hypothetical protein
MLAGSRLLTTSRLRTTLDKCTTSTSVTPAELKRLLGVSMSWLTKERFRTQDLGFKSKVETVQLTPVPVNWDGLLTGKHLQVEAVL